MTEDAGTPETDRIERDLAQTRARLDATIDALQEKFSPGQVVDQAVTYLKEGGGGDFGRNLARSVRDNPIPAALVGIGLAWLMVSGSLRGGGASGSDDDASRTDAGTRLLTGPPPYRGGGGTGSPGSVGSTPRVRVYGDAGDAGSGYGSDEAYRMGGGPARGYRGGGDEASADGNRHDGGGIAARAGAAVSAVGERAAALGQDMAERGQATMQNLYERGREAAEDAYEYGRGAVGGAYGYGRQAASGAYGYGDDFLGVVRANPVPAALIGLGVAWLLFSRNQAGSDREGPRAAYVYRDRDSYQGYRGYRGGAYSGGGGIDQAARGDQAVRGAYASASLQDLGTKADEAGAGVGRETDEADDAYEGRVHAARGAVLGLKRSVDETVAAFRERVDAAVTAAGDAYARARGQVAEIGADALERGRSAVQGLYERGREAAGDAFGYGRGAAEGAYGYSRSVARGTAAGGRSTLSYIQDQPLLLAAIGVSLGAALALLIPPTRYERQAARGLREDLRGRVGDLAGGAVDSATRVAESVVGAAREAVGREGLADISPSGLAAAARQGVADAAERVRHVVEETAAAGREAVERELGGGTTGAGTTTRA